MITKLNKILILIMIIVTISCSKKIVQPEEQQFQLSTSFPVDNDTDIQSCPTLIWSSNAENIQFYHIYFGKSQNPEILKEFYMRTYLPLTNLEYDTTYYWKVDGYDGENWIQSNVSCFTIGAAPEPGKMINVIGGIFQMGDRIGNGEDDELPLHNVSLSDFFISQYEVTQGEFEVVMGYNPVSEMFAECNKPTYGLTWQVAAEYCNTRSELEGFTPCYNTVTWICDFSANGYRLPTEAEWEYAARGGIYEEDNFEYSGSNAIEDVKLSSFHIIPDEVGLMLPNQLDIYDMSANVFEWCNDRYGFASEYYEECESQGTVVDPPGSDYGYHHVVRGGYFGSDSTYCRVSSRIYCDDEYDCENVGFRVVRRIH